MSHGPTDTSSPLYCPPDRLPREGETLFSEYVHARSKPDYTVDAAGCWIWQKGLLAGYAISTKGRVARLYWERAHGPIPDGFHIHHKCKTPACINPEHLEAIDRYDHFAEHKLGEQNDLTLVDLTAIREMALDPEMTTTKVAALTGLHRNAIQRLWAGDSWKGVFPSERLRPYTHCPRCQAEITGKKRNKKFCSPKCRTLFNQQAARDRARAA